MYFPYINSGRKSEFMSQDSNQHEGESPLPVPKDENPSADQPAYGQGPFSRPLPRPTGCWAGCIRIPCCLTNRPDRRDKALGMAAL